MNNIFVKRLTHVTVDAFKSFGKVAPFLTWITRGSDSIEGYVNYTGINTISQDRDMAAARLGDAKDNYGDKFISDNKQIKSLLQDLPELKAVEMEGGAVAQILLLESIPYLAIRVISDKADEDAPESFIEFLKKYEIESWSLIKSLLINISNKPKVG